MLCRRCRKSIAPDEPMAVLVVESEMDWDRTTLERLARAPGRWHVRCAPLGMRPYMPAVYGGPGLAETD